MEQTLFVWLTPMVTMKSYALLRCWFAVQLQTIHLDAVGKLFVFCLDIVFFS